MRVLIVEDDPPFCERLSRALRERDYTVSTASSVVEGRGKSRSEEFDAAILDFNLPDGSGLTLIADILVANPDARIIVLSGYATLKSAVAAVREGAAEYLVKPIDVDEIDAVLLGANRTAILDAQTLRSPNEVRWKHIEATMRLSNGNLSAAARSLNLHRRTLQRILRNDLGRPAEG